MKMFFTLCLLGAFYDALSQQPSALLHFDDRWRFKAGDDSTWAQPAFADADWTPVTAQKWLEDQGFSNFEGFCWYRKQIDIPATLKAAVAKGDGVLISFQQADDCDAFYFNGHHIGTTGSFPPQYASAYGKPRSYLVPARYIRFDQPNTVAVRLYDRGGNAGILAPQLQLRPATVMDRMQLSVIAGDSDKVFLNGAPLALQIQVTNTNKAAAAAGLHVAVTTDDFKPVATKVFPLNLKPSAQKRQVYQLPVAPGFYRFSIFLSHNGDTSTPVKFNMGYEPEKIREAPTAKSDFATYWQESLRQLAQVAPEYSLQHQPQYSNSDYDVYEVAMNSFGGERVKAYYAQPKRPGKHPVSIEYQGYSSGPYPPNVQWDGFAHLLMSIRGQGLNKPGNKYGDWIVHGLEHKDNYYYRGAFLDAVRGIDFVCSRAEIDTARIVAQGGSQGGALAFAAAALDKRIKACAPTVPFLSDYPHYFEIVRWPRSSFEVYRQAHPNVSWEQIHDVISYCDIRNLASMIECPMLMGIGVQDEVCPPHINFAAFNAVRGAKQWIAYADEGHSVGADFYRQRLAFFKQQLGL